MRELTTIELESVFGGDDRNVGTGNGNTVNITINF
jgi:hypothetical protein